MRKYMFEYSRPWSFWPHLRWIRPKWGSGTLVAGLIVFAGSYLAGRSGDLLGSGESEYARDWKIMFGYWLFSTAVIIGTNLEPLRDAEASPEQ